jgi:N-acyl-L-homoserine lactone synthetase
VLWRRVLARLAERIHPLSCEEHVVQEPIYACHLRIRAEPLSQVASKRVIQFTPYHYASIFVSIGIGTKE